MSGFSKNISVYAIFNDQSFNDTLTNDIISFEQLGPEMHFLKLSLYASRTIISYFLQYLNLGSSRKHAYIILTPLNPTFI